MERKSNAIHEIHTLPIIIIYGDEGHLITEKPTRKSYVSPYAKFDRIKKNRR